MIELDNFQAGHDADESEVHQRCVLLCGKSTTIQAQETKESCVVVETKDDSGQALFPEQQWPMCLGHFKALVLLSPGLNRVTITSGEDATCRTEVRIRYTPLLQTPPLHLAIMVAKDSPLLIDCPPSKFGSISTTHSSLDAAIAKFRMTAYMWQALTAEDLRAKGLGRRSFRLEEEWTLDTLTQRALHTPTMGLAPKIHVIRTPKTTAELRDADLAQQNPHARNKDSLHSIFTQALLAHGPPFTTHARPIVAGLILDSHYDAADTKLILAHAALGSHDPKGLSLGMFGSHITYAWPRFLEEVPTCLLDNTPTGDTVGNDNGECGSMWRACAVGQGAFLHEVGHAMGAPHTEGIMLRGYSPDWPRAFLGGVRRVDEEGGGELVAVEGGKEHECRWDVRDALKFKALRHFWLPGDAEVKQQAPVVEVRDEGDGEYDGVWVEAKCDAGIGRVVLTVEEGQAVDDDRVSVTNPAKSLRYSPEELTERFGKGKAIAVEVTGMNGKQCTVGDIRSLLRNRSFLQVPGTGIRLQKRAISSGDFSTDDNEWYWAVMLKKRDSNGKLVDGTKIDLRVGCALDGAIVYYKDGTKIPCGPRGPRGNDPNMGGHQSRKLGIPEGVEVVKVAVTRAGYGRTWSLRGLRMWLSNGKAMGALNCHSDDADVQVLEPPASHKIIGFYGKSGRWGMCGTFGIVTAPRDVMLPDSVYDMDELQNKPMEESHRDKRRRIDEEKNDEHSDENDDEAGDDDGGGSCHESWEDEDTGYDDGSDDEIRRKYQK